MIKRTVEISQGVAQVKIRRIEDYLPPDGQVRVLVVTEKQFERMRVYWGKMRKPPEEPTRQLMIF